MFGFLKNKLKEWVDKAKDNLKPEEKLEEIEETKEEIQEEVKEEKKKQPKKEKKEKIKKVKEEIEKSDKIIEQAKEEKPAEEVPLEFNVALQKYEPNLEKIKEKVKEIKEANLESSDLEKSELAIQKTLEEKEFELTEEMEEDGKKEEIKEQKKPGFISRIFGKKPKIEKEIEKEEEKEETKEVEEKKSFFQKVKSTFTYKISEEDFNKLFEDLEMLLLENNVALEVVEDLKKSLGKKLIGKEIKKDNLEKEIKTELKNSLNELIIDPEDPLIKIKEKKESEEPFVILFFGINGTGKTTSIAKITNLLKENNLSVVLAAADTFRAASIEQIQEHADKLNVPLIKHDYQSDPAAVGFDAIKYAKNHHIDVVLIDTAGRMHTKTNLLAEMEKICRVTNPDLKVFVAESIAGNDATEQAKTFNEMIGIDGSILSKADIDEKGGTIISVSHATKKPIFYLGTGQTYKDLKLFNKEEYIESLGL